MLRLEHRRPAARLAPLQHHLRVCAALARRCPIPALGVVVRLLAPRRGCDEKSKEDLHFSSNMCSLQGGLDPSKTNFHYFVEKYQKVAISRKVP